MSTEYEPKLIVGWLLGEVFSSGTPFEGDKYQLQEYLEDEHGMWYIPEEDIIGFCLEEDHLNISLSSASMLQQKAREFKKITGVEAKLCSCIFSY